jgi:protein gp37
MSDITSIQWADTTVNPIMGCGGCELFPKPATVLASISDAMNAAGASPKVSKKAVEIMFQQLVDQCINELEQNGQRQPDHSDQVTTTNISQLKERFVGQVKALHGKAIANAADAAIRQSVTCYAYVLHNMRGLSILNGNRKGHKGHSPVFEKLTRFKGRMSETAALEDLLGREHPATDWKLRLPRLIFVSDMGDALTEREDFEFLEMEVMPAIRSENGGRHLWLWLTKRPHLMAEFANKAGGFPDNVCAMTTLTGPDAGSMKRLADLKKVNASIKGLSIEPLWERIAPKDLDLSGIDWVIVGGESGSGNLTRPFDLAWAEELRDYCRKKKVAFFFKQAGTMPVRNGERIRYADESGGDWMEWEPSLRVREFPKAFHDYRNDEMTLSDQPRTIEKPKKPKEPELIAVTPEEKAEFKRLDKVVRKGVEAFVEAGEALLAIHKGKLWRAGGHQTWDDYCRTVAGMSRGHAHRLLKASECMTGLKTSPIGDVLPVSESQVRPLLRLAEPARQVQAWNTAVERAEGNQPTAAEVAEVVFEILHPEGPGEKTQSRAQQRIDLVGRLKEVIGKRKSWEQVEKLLGELEELL